MLLTKQQILGADDLPTEEVDVWGGKVLVIALSAKERENLRLSIEKEGDALQIMVKLLSLTIVDKDKNRIFTEKDLEVLEKKSAKEIDKVFAVAQRLSGHGEKTLEEIEKNSESQSESSNLS